MTNGPIALGADVGAVADEAFALLNTGRQVEPFSARGIALDLETAYRVTAAVRERREARGEVVLGRKIGFTNRTIWQEYGVSAPMWGYLYDRTVHHIADLDGGFSLAGLAEPRLEPEVMFYLATAPRPGMTERELLGCIDGIAHGYEIVQSIFPGWVFTLPDTVAAYGLHGALLMGPMRPLVGSAGDWLRTLATFEIELRKDGTVADRGHAANVLDGPLSALRHFNNLLAEDPVNPPLAAGEIVTTGTLTRAFPVAAGETWSTAPHGIGLDGIEMRFR